MFNQTLQSSSMEDDLGEVRQTGDSQEVAAKCEEMVYFTTIFFFFFFQNGKKRVTRQGSSGTNSFKYNLF